jgi:hypothetical protein
MTKIIDVSDKAEPLPKGYNFPALQRDPDPDAAVFDSGSTSPSHAAEDEVGMTDVFGVRHKRDPADVLLIQRFIARHGLRLVGFLPQLPAGPFRCDGLLWPPNPARPNLTRFPFRFAMDKAGKRWVTPSEEARLRIYEPVEGEASYRAQEAVRNNAGVYEDRLSVQESGMSLGNGKYYRGNVPESQKLPKEGELPERHCLNPECLKEIAAKKHHNVKYCGSKCEARAKELRRLDRKSQAARPSRYRNESEIIAESAVKSAA